MQVTCCCAALSEQRCTLDVYSQHWRLKWHWSETISKAALANEGAGNARFPLTNRRSESATTPHVLDPSAFSQQWSPYVCTFTKSRCVTDPTR